MDREVKYPRLKLGIRFFREKSMETKSAPGLMAGAANIIRIYRMDITNILVPAMVDSFFKGFNPRLATQQKNSSTASVASCTHRVGNVS